MLTKDILPSIQAELAKQKVDGWLLFDFRGLNPIAADLIGIEGHVTRRVFAWIPASGTPVGVEHAIEPRPWQHWPTEWKREVYSSWRTLESTLGTLVKGKKVAMEYSAGDAVPYLDRIPAGVIEMVRAAGAEVVTSGELVTRFYAAWTAEDIAAHSRAAEVIAKIARDAFNVIGERAKSKSPATEFEMTEWIRNAFSRAGLITDHGPNVSGGPSAADPHYEPTATKSRTIGPNEVVLIDLWATEKQGHPYADQTWMGVTGAPSSKVAQVWETVRDARDAAISLVTENAAKRKALPGAAADDAARQVIESAGYGKYFTHRTGHSIDARDLHGSGPHLDNLESRETRLLVPGVGFSIEPGIYIPGEFGMRTEVNVYIEPDRAVVTPAVYQKDLFVV
jgi:Xaa-Pro aminopeptidase